jgi:uncharacterized iron-regulated protein
MRPALVLAVALAQVSIVYTASAQVGSAAPPPTVHPPIAASYVPQRVFDTRRRTFSDFEAMAADLARADFVVVGEQHGNPNTHRLEAALLQALLRRGVPLIVSLEMFERDVQPLLNAYLAGTLPEETFLSQSRPWPRYASDYRPLVELSRAHQWPVVAANVPRRLAGEVATHGPTALDHLPPADRALVARDLECPEDDYFRRFVEAMQGHPVAGADKSGAEPPIAETQQDVDRRYFWSQCVKDETMAESMVEAWQRASAPAVTLVHYNGAFHSDFGAGVVERVRRRVPGRRVAVVSILPVADLDRLDPGGDDLKRADYLVYTTR